jgi:hypothetical protein
MSNMAGVLKKTGTACSLQAPVFILCFCGFRLARRFSFCVAFFCFVCLRLMSCVPNYASFSGLSVVDCPFSFSLAFICTW